MGLNRNYMQPKGRRYEILLAVMICISPVAVLEVEWAYGARAADIVTRTLVMTGERALAIAHILGLPADRAVELELRWAVGSATRNCSYGLPPSSEERRCEDIKEPVNRLRFSPGPVPELALEGSWLDMSTGTGVPVPRFVFHSPPIGAADQSGWSELLKSIRDSTPDNRTRTDFTVHSGTEHAPYIEVQIHQEGDESAITLGFDEDDASLRNKKLVRYRECRGRPQQLDGGGC